MFAFFDKVIGFFEGLFSFIINIVSGLTTALGVLASSLTLPFALTGYVPTILASAIVIVVAIAVAKFIIGR